MKKNTAIAVVLAAAALVGCSNEQAEVELVLEQDQDKVGYALGAALGNRLKAGQVDVNPDAVKAGLLDALSGEELRLSQEELVAIDQQLKDEREARALAQFQKVAERNLQTGLAFLQAYAENSDTVVLPSGLQYRVINEGEGEQPATDATVVLHYQAKHVAGPVFDSTYQRGAPVEIAVNTLLPAMIEVLPKMSVGAKYEVVAPPELAYGIGSKDGQVGPNETIVFVLELLDIKADPES